MRAGVDWFKRLDRLVLETIARSCIGLQWLVRLVSRDLAATRILDPNAVDTALSSYQRLGLALCCGLGRDAACLRAARTGCIDALCWMRRWWPPEKWSDDLYEAAAVGGHIAVLQWLQRETPCVWKLESMEAVDRAIRPADLGFDAAVEFPPHGLATPAEDAVTIVKDGWAGYRYDYPATAATFAARPSVGYPRYPAVFPSWDNTPRQPLRGTSFDRASPDAFRAYAEEKIEEIRRFHMGDERLLFINAWNEWAEGAHLEPDTAYGHRWLESLRDTLTGKRWS